MYFILASLITQLCGKQNQVLYLSYKQITNKHKRVCKRIVDYDEEEEDYDDPKNRRRMTSKNNLLLIIN